MSSLKRSMYNDIAKKAAKVKATEYAKNIVKYSKTGDIPAGAKRTIARLASNKARGQAWQAVNRANVVLKDVGKVGKVMGLTAVAGFAYNRGKRILKEKKAFDADIAAQIKSEDDLYKMRMKAIREGKGNVIKKTMR